MVRTLARMKQKGNGNESGDTRCGDGRSPRRLHKRARDKGDSAALERRGEWAHKGNIGAAVEQRRTMAATIGILAMAPHTSESKDRLNSSRRAA